MIILGIVLIIVGVLVHLGLLITLGVVFALIGALLFVLGGSHPVGGRRHWF